MRITKVARVARVLGLVALLAVGCRPTASGAPAPSIPAPTQAAAPPSPWLAQAEAIGALVESMAAAVQAGDRAGYLALVDLSNPTFALEHTRWVDDWSGANPATEYALQISGLVLDDNEATGQMQVTWFIHGDEETSYRRTATYYVRFTGGPDAWRYAGESWVDTQVEHFLIHVAPELKGSATVVAADLPSIYDHVTSALAYEPGAPLEIKLYQNAPALVATTLLSLPDIRGWNEPGEALKIHFSPGGPSVASIIAHEFTHFLCFDRAGTQRTRMPWWLDEGIATYVAASYEDTQPNERLAQVVAWEASGELAPWDSMAVFEDTPVDLWKFVYPQGYAMTRYVTEEYGEAKRNAWLAAMATEMDIDEATPAILNLTFDELDAAFRGWLSGQ